MAVVVIEDLLVCYCAVLPLTLVASRTIAAAAVLIWIRYDSVPAHEWASVVDVVLLAVYW